jgi:hypothetical protein
MLRPSRRGFLAGLGALTGALALDTPFAEAEPVADDWDMSWLDRLKGKHKQVFDMSDMDIGLIVVKNWLDAWKNVYKLETPQVNAVVGIGGHAFPVNISDEMYRKFPIGELWKVNDPETTKPAMRNIFIEGPATGQVGAGVRPLQARGAIFWQCNNALNGVAARIGTAVKRPQPEVYQELKAALNPGVILVPAHTMLIGICQERGCSYESLG